MLHRHLTVAFRALDRKWGEPVDLDTTEEAIPCLPAVVEKPTTTFSSEDYLNKIRRCRPKPYSRNEKIVRKSKMKDSFSNISVSRYSSGDLGESVSSLETGASNQSRSPGQQSSSRQKGSDVLMEEMRSLVESLNNTLTEPFEESTGSATNDLERRKEELENIFRELKNTAISYVEKKYRKRSNF